MARDAVSAVEREFQGTSHRGDLKEALQNAINEAKNGLRTDLISWRLAKLSGVDGGAVLQNDVTVTIVAKPGP